MEQNNTQMMVARPAGDSMLTAFDSFPQMMDIADKLANSSIIPQRFVGNPGSVLIALDIAARSQMNPLMVMQNLYTVYGVPSFSGQFVIALLRRCGLYKNIRWEYETPGNWRNGVRLIATRLDDGEEEGPVIDEQLAMSMGWLTKKDTMWTKMPDQMARYRAASWFAKLNCPDVLLGLPTAEEVQDSPLHDGEMRVVSPKKDAAQGSRLVATKPGELSHALEAAAMPAEDRAKVEQKREAAEQRRAERKAAAVDVSATTAAEDACGTAKRLLAEQGATWKEFTEWAKAHNLTVPQGGSREDYNALCDSILMNKDLFADFKTELKKK